MYGSVRTNEYRVLLSEIYCIDFGKIMWRLGYYIFCLLLCFLIGCILLGLDDVDVDALDSSCTVSPLYLAAKHLNIEAARDICCHST